MILHETRAFDVRSGVRHGFIVELGDRWVAFAIVHPHPDIFAYLNMFERLHDAYAAIMEVEDPRLRPHPEGAGEHPSEG